jgi:DNA-binding Lrp family transcriptional regulator
MANDTVLDEIDAKILRELQNNARIANKDLARLVLLSPSSCLQRVRALERRGAIKAYRAEVNPPVLGRNLDALIAVRLRGQSRQTLDAFEQDMMNLPETVMLAHITGDDDALLQISVRDVDHLQAFILDHLTSRRDVAHIKTHLIFAHRRRKVLEPLPAH